MACSLSAIKQMIKSASFDRFLIDIKFYWNLLMFNNYFLIELKAI